MVGTIHDKVGFLYFVKHKMTCMHQYRVETGSGYPGYAGQLGHVLSGSSGSDQVYKISGSDPDSTLDHVC